MESYLYTAVNSEGRKVRGKSGPKMWFIFTRF